MLSWYFREDNHVLQLQNTYPFGHLGNVHCEMMCDIFIGVL